MPVKVFFCYARKDKFLRDTLEGHLEMLRRLEWITTWHDREILPGKDWKREIDMHLDTADIILLLVSPHFLRSNYCYGIEMQRALKRHKEGETHVIPVILRPVEWKETPIGRLQALPADGKPITIWRNRDEAFQNVAKGLTKIVKILLFENQSTQEHKNLSDHNNRDLDQEQHDVDMMDISSSQLDRESTTPYILILDDDLFANKLAQFVLAKEGYEVDTVADPRIALKIIKSRKPNLLILNIVMPYMNGFEVE